MRLPIAALCFVLSTAFVPSAHARPTVELREVGSRIQDNTLDLTQLLRTALRREIAEVDLSHAKTSAILSATVVRFERGEKGAECTISAAVRTRQGKLVAILSGKATSLTGSHAELALDGAVKGALRGLSSALR